jgi:rhodanese-related sulfurtransferase
MLLYKKNDKERDMEDFVFEIITGLVLCFLLYRFVIRKYNLLGRAKMHVIKPRFSSHVLAYCIGKFFAKRKFTYVIDVRSEAETKEVFLKNMGNVVVINIPIDEVRDGEDFCRRVLEDSRLRTVNEEKEEEVLIMCTGGVRSAWVCHEITKMERLKFKPINLEGGLENVPDKFKQFPPGKTRRKIEIDEEKDEEDPYV